MALASVKLKVECLGPPLSEARGYLIYLHGFEELKSSSREEMLNRKALTEIAKELNIRMALPEGPACPKNRRCWPAKNPAAVLETFSSITEARTACFKDKPYSLVGFSNGGYFAFKLYKAHQDPLLKTIIASSSSGLWNPAQDKPNPLSRFQLMIGSRDLMRSDAEAFMSRLTKSDPKAALTIFTGGHVMDQKTLLELLRTAQN